MALKQGPHLFPLYLKRFGRLYGAVLLAQKLGIFFGKPVRASGLATGEGLSNRQISIDPQCHRCGASPETTTHILIECSFAQAAWFACPLSVNLSTTAPNIPDISAWISHLLDISKRDKAQGRWVQGLSSFMCWYIWRARNESLHNGTVISPMDVLALASKAFHEFLSASESGKVCSPSSAPLVDLSIKWTPPPAGFLNLNCDASLQQDNPLGGLGCVISNSAGKPILACSYPASFSTIAQGEALAIRIGLMHAIPEGIDRLIVESDNKAIIHLLADPSARPPVEILPVIEDITFLLPCFVECSFVFIPRLINNVADTLARRAFSLESEMIWLLSSAWLTQLCNSDSMCTSLS
ncbi:uncharacterized protein LOC122643218 [Telopea speciosissima]|uniref:uncharacterized protein LOC122643218 n=1 Tax=Telopea speciosissima TaxID=54955 RepID=UPI001CC60E4E|nr:uncharacterized protein LOC122643218 [Telopea speciosissima]